MMQAKLINDVTDLSWLSRAFDNDVKINVFNDVSTDWVTLEEIEERYGEEGVKALKFFEKIRMVDSRWTMSENGKAKKEYHAFYSSFHIHVMTSIDMIRDVFSIILMDEKEFNEVEEKIYQYVGDNGELSREVEKEFNFSPVQMRCIVKRSHRLEYRGMKIERLTEN
ncbi:MAG TPA: hypothetical protein ENJ70_01930 [Thermoplasmatales archaeon]|nr:ArsR family transcriptional regulator [Thermoplasmata archaeon]HHO57294.1 hypothetical protein [Thermoplasmatales archaeon]